MTRKFNKTLIGAAVLAALSGAPAAYAFDVITVSRDGGPSGNIDLSSLGWAPSTVLLENAFTILTDEIDPLIKTSVAAASYTLWTQGTVSGFNNGNVAVSAVVGTEWSFQLGMTQEPIGSGITTQPLAATQTYQSLLAATPTVNFFKIFYDAVGDANNLQGTNFGDDKAAGLIAGVGGTCDPLDPSNNTAAAGKLILCGVILDGGVTALLKTGTTPGDSGAIKVALDGFGIDNYDGVADGTALGDTTAIGTSRSPTSGGGSLDVNVDVLYQDFAFFISNVSTVNVGIDLNQNANLKLNFQQTDPSRSVVGNPWSVGTDTDTVTDLTSPFVTTRAMNNFACNTATDVDCSFVAQSTGATSFNGSTVPEPDTLALMGLGLLTIGVGAMRRRKRLA